MPITQVVYAKSDVAGLRGVEEAIRAAGGRGNSTAARAMWVRIGLEILGRIKTAFETKARGGTDEAGDRWQELSPKTKAYSRRHPGLPPASKRAAYRPSYGLTEKQRKRWWENYSQSLARFQGDKSAAAKMAWTIAKDTGAVTLLEKYGSTSTEILRDTGLLLNSLTPGVPAESAGSGIPSVPNQVFRVGEGSVTVGSSVKYAAAHHHGIPGRLPQRRLWSPPSSWPSSHWDGILDHVKQGLIDIVLEKLAQ